MRNNLNSCPKVFSTAFLTKHFTINFTSCHVGIFVEIDIDETFIVTQVQICFSSVICHKNFPVLVRTHSSRINIDIRVKFLNGYLETTIFQETAQTCCHNPFPNRRYHTTSYKNIFRRHRFLFLKCSRSC